ncbi:MAG: WxcM-like domain-containing protein [Flavobacteriaceae bacterium]|nr:WxcM-like domain-containing protein [Flavobacteriaceae bacterium]
MSQETKFIEGGLHADERGNILFVNDFDLSPVKRFYITTNKDVNIIRAWQGHKIESKWFYCLSGAFDIRLIKMDNWENPTMNLNVENYILKADQPGVLHIPKGFLNGFRAIEQNSRLLVFSDLTIDESMNDIYRFPKNYWFDWPTI